MIGFAQYCSNLVRFESDCVLQDNGILALSKISSNLRILDVAHLSDQSIISIATHSSKLLILCDIVRFTDSSRYVRV